MLHNQIHTLLPWEKYVWKFKTVDALPHRGGYQLHPSLHSRSLVHRRTASLARCNYTSGRKSRISNHSETHLWNPECQPITAAISRLRRELISASAALGSATVGAAVGLRCRSATGGQSLSTVGLIYTASQLWAAAAVGVSRRPQPLELWRPAQQSPPQSSKVAAGKTTSSDRPSGNATVAKKKRKRIQAGRRVQNMRYRWRTRKDGDMELELEMSAWECQSVFLGANKEEGKSTCCWQSHRPAPNARNWVGS